MNLSGPYFRPSRATFSLGLGLFEVACSKKVKRWTLSNFSAQRAAVHVESVPPEKRTTQVSVCIWIFCVRFRKKISRDFSERLEWRVDKPSHSVKPKISESIGQKQGDRADNQSQDKLREFHKKHGRASVATRYKVEII